MAQRLNGHATRDRDSDASTVRIPVFKKRKSVSQSRNERHLSTQAPTTITCVYSGRKKEGKNLIKKNKNKKDCSAPAHVLEFGGMSSTEPHNSLEKCTKDPKQFLPR